MRLYVDELLEKWQEQVHVRIKFPKFKLEPTVINGKKKWDHFIF